MGREGRKRIWAGQQGKERRRKRSIYEL